MQKDQKPESFSDRNQLVLASRMLEHDATKEPQRVFKNQRLSFARKLLELARKAPLPRKP